MITPLVKSSYSEFENVYYLRIDFMIVNEGYGVSGVVLDNRGLPLKWSEMGHYDFGYDVKAASVELLQRLSRSIARSVEFEKIDGCRL